MAKAVHAAADWRRYRLTSEQKRDPRTPQVFTNMHALSHKNRGRSIFAVYLGELWTGYMGCLASFARLAILRKSLPAINLPSYQFNNANHPVNLHALYVGPKGYLVAKIQLLKSLGNQQADKILSETIGVYELMFPGRIQGYYVTGSYAVGTPLPNSDVDVTIVFKGKFEDSEYERADQLYLHLAGLSAIYPDLKMMDEYGLHHPEGFDIIFAVFTKGNSILVYGEDIRDQIPLPPHSDFTWMLSSGGFYYLQEARGNSEKLTVPLTHPDPTGHLLGREPTDRLDIVLTTSLVASSLAAIKSGQYVYSKTNIAKVYKELIGDEWSDVIADVFSICRSAWEYKIPDDEKSHHKFRQLCHRVLAFENAFLEVYIAYLKAESTTDEMSRRERAIERLQSFLT